MAEKKLKMKIIHVVQAVAHGSLSYADIASGGRGVTGSEQAMLYLARAQAKKGHQVIVYLPTERDSFQEGVELLNINAYWPRIRRADNADVVISWLSADALRNISPKALRIYSYQINDHMMNGFGYEKQVDLFVAVSEAHKKHLLTEPGAPPEGSRWAVIPNGVDNARFAKVLERVPKRCAYLSSPDRGLHWALAMWPEIRFAHPTAELHIFYEVQKWLDNARLLNSEIGLRSHYVVNKINALRTHGVILHGAVPPDRLADELLRSDIMIYPCDPIRFTEGFGVAVMEAHAAGLLSITTDADALGEVYSESGCTMIPRVNGTAWTDQFVEAVITTLNNSTDPKYNEVRFKVQDFASKYDWDIICDMWQSEIDKAMEVKDGQR